MGRKNFTHSFLSFFLFLSVFLTLSSNLKAQSFQGTDFWFGYMANAEERPNNPVTLQFQVHIVCDRNTTGTISIPLSGYSVPFSVTANIVTTLTLPNNLAGHQIYDGRNESVQPRGVHVVSNDPCVVYLGNYEDYSSDAATAIPTPSLGNLYHVITYGGTEGLGPAEFIIVGTQNATTVTIQTTTGTVARPNGAKTWTITLNQGQTYHVQASALIYLPIPRAETDLMGSIVTADKPVAVYAGNECTYVGGCPFCDHLFEQVRPLNTWGYQYFSTSTAKAAVGTQDILRVYSPQAGTSFTFNGAPFTLGARAFQEFRVNGPFYINSNNPINVSQYLTGSFCASPPLEIDPLMMDIIGVEQYANEYIFATSPFGRYTRHYATVLIEDAEKTNLRLNGGTVTPIDALTGLATTWVPIPGTAYVYGYIRLTGGLSYTIKTTTTAPFGLYVYGYGEEESYGYTAGGNLNNLCKLNTTNLSVCQGTNVTLTVSSDFVDLETAFKWYKNPTGGALLYTGTSYNVGILASTDSFYVQLDNRACDNARQKVKVTVLPKPISTFTVTPASACVNEDVTLTFTGSYDGSKPVVFGWSVDGGTPTPTNTAGPHLVKWTTPSTPGPDKKVTLTVSQGSCSSLVTSKDVKVYPIPGTPLVSDVSVCEGTSATLTVSNPVAGGTYEWTGPNGYTSSTMSPTLASTTPGMSGTYKVKVKLNGCYSAVKDVLLTVNAKPADPVITINPTAICDGQTMTLGTSNTPAYPASAIYAWTGPSGYTSSSATPTITGMDGLKQGDYKLKVTVNGCLSSQGLKNVVVNPTPDVPVAKEDGPYCAGSPINLSVDNPIVGASYSWTGPGFTSSTENPTRTNSTVSMSGTYSVTATENGCTSLPGSVNVTVNPIPATPNPSANSPICLGGTLQLNTPAVNNATYSWTGPASFVSYLQNPSRTNVTLSMSGYYKVKVKVNGCESQEGSTLEVLVNSPDNVNFSYNPLRACSGSPTNPTTIAPGLAPGSFTVNPTSGLSVSSSNGDINLAASTPKDNGPYAITFTSTGTCPASKTVNFSFVSNVDDDFKYATKYCVGDLNAVPDFSDDPMDADTYSGVAGTFSEANNKAGLIFVDTKSGEIDLTNSTPGSYTIKNEVKDCSDVVFSIPATFDIVINARPLAPNLSNVSKCEGENVTIDPAIAASNYYWTDPSGVAVNASKISSSGVLTLANAALTDAGSYALKIKDNNGCLSDPANSIVTINAIPTQPTPSNNGPVCEGTTLTFNANVIGGGVYSYNWTGPNSYVSATKDPIRTSTDPAMSGTYNLTVTENGCTSIPGAMNVIVNPIPSQPLASNNGAPGICEGGILNLSTPTISNATYSWQFPGGSVVPVQNPSVNNVTQLDGGTYLITITVNGCTSPAGSTNVVINPLPAAPIPSSNAPLCEGSRLSFSASNVGAGAVYNWAGPNGFTATEQYPGIDNVLFAQHSGNYTVYAILDGCTGPVSSALSPVINKYDVAEFTYASKSYCQTGTDATALKDPAAAAGSFSSSPFGLDIDATSGKIDLSNSQPGAVYLVKYETSGNCINRDTNSVWIIAPPKADYVYAGSPYCINSTLTPNPVLDPDAKRGVFRVSPTTGLSIDSLTGKIDPKMSVPAIYTVTNYIAPENGCAAVSSPYQVDILDIDDADFSYAKNSYCVSGTEIPTPIRAYPQGIFSYEPTGLIIDQNTGIIDPALSVPGTYNVTYFTTGGKCSDNHETVITIVDKPKTGFIYDDYYCKDLNGVNPKPTLQGADPGGIYSSTGSNSSGVVVNPTTGEINLALTQPGVYNIQYMISAAKGCAAESTVFPVKIEALPNSDFTKSIENVCVGKPVKFSYAGNPSNIEGYSWNLGTYSSKSGDEVNGYELVWEQSGLKTVSLTVQTANCTSLPTSKTVMVNDYAIPAFASDPPLPDTLVFLDQNTTPTVNFTNLSEYADNYTWDFGDGSPTEKGKDVSHTYTTFETPFMVTLTANNVANCSAQVSMGPVYVSTKFILDIPKAFTPNGDGQNDDFLPVDLGMKSFSLEVYNRWGERIFYSTNRDMKWDGTFQKEPVPVGVYVYILKGQSMDSRGVERKGLVTVKR